MTNTQPREKYVQSHNLDVQSIFETIQGEGPLVGMPSIFVRLAGCNLDCPLCDTDYTSTRTLMGIEDVLAHVRDKETSRSQRLIVLTGGEPFRQAATYDLIECLIESGYLVQVETNGTLCNEKRLGELKWDYRDLLTVVVSPKSGCIHKAYRRYIDAYKYVVRAGEVDDEDGLPLSVLGNNIDRAAKPFSEHVEYGTVPIYLQPCDEDDPIASEKNAAETIHLCLKYGYRFCPQMHKIYGLP